jgi:hypothetical protein
MACVARGATSCVAAYRLENSAARGTRLDVRGALHSPAGRDEACAGDDDSVSAPVTPTPADDATAQEGSGHTPIMAAPGTSRKGESRTPMRMGPTRGGGGRSCRPASWDGFCAESMQHTKGGNGKSQNSSQGPGRSTPPGRRDEACTRGGNSVAALAS